MDDHIKYKGELRLNPNKWSACDTDEFSKLEEDEELWVFRVPAEFDASELNGKVLDREGKLKFTTEDGTTYEACQEDSMAQVAQLHCLFSSGNHSNGLLKDRAVTRSFRITTCPEDDDGLITDAEEEENEQERLRRVEELVNKLKSPSRKQITFTTCYQHLGEATEDDASEILARLSNPKKKSKSKSKHSSDASTTSSKKKRKRSFDENASSKSPKKKKSKKSKRERNESM